MIVLYTRTHIRRLTALLTLLLAATLLSGGPASTPAQAITGGSIVYLPLIRHPGEAQIDVTIELVGNTIVARGDRIWIKLHLRNRGSAQTTANTAINLPFDQAELDYFTQDIDANRGDRFLGIYQGHEVRLEVGRVDPNTTATISVWFNVQDDVPDGTEISLRANYTYNGQTSDTNQVRVSVTPPGTVSGFCGPFSGTNGRMTVFPETGGAGTFFTFESDCFEPDEDVVTWLNTPSGVEPLELRATADVNGAASFQLNSRGFTPGTNYGFVAQGLSSDIQVLGPFVVTPSAIAQSSGMRASVMPVPAHARPAARHTPEIVPAQASGGVHGVVTGDSGAPLADVLILVNNSFGGLVDSGVTDASGAYSFGALPDGSYTLSFTTDQTANATTAAYARAVRSITVSKGTVTALNVQLQRGGRISGVVVGAGNGPLEGVYVFVYNAQNEIMGTTTSDAAGAYTTAALPSDSYRLEFEPLPSDVLSTTAYLTTTLSSVPVTAPNPTTGANVTLNLDPNVRQIAGRVMAQATGAPLGGTTVVVSSNTTGKLIDLAITRPDGTYRTHNLPADAYRLFFLTLFSRDSVTKTYVGAAYGNPIDLSAAGIRGGVDIALEKGAATSGQVTGADTGAQLAGVVVAVRVPSSGQIVGVGLTDASGTYTTSGVPSGTFSVEFAPDLSPVVATATYQRATVDNVVVSGTNTVGGVDAQLVRDPRKIVRLPLIQRS